MNRCHVLGPWQYLVAVVGLHAPRCPRGSVLRVVLRQNSREPRRWTHPPSSSLSLSLFFPACLPPPLRLRQPASSSLSLGPPRRAALILGDRRCGPPPEEDVRDGRLNEGPRSGRTILGPDRTEIYWTTRFLIDWCVPMNRAARARSISCRAAPRGAHLGPVSFLLSFTPFDALSNGGLLRWSKPVRVGRSNFPARIIKGISALIFQLTRRSTSFIR